MTSDFDIFRVAFQSNLIQELILKISVLVKIVLQNMNHHAFRYQTKSAPNSLYIKLKKKETFYKQGS